MHTTNTADDAYWDSGTFEIGFLLTLNLADDGVLFLSGNNSAFTKNLTQSTTSQKPSVEIYYRAVIDVDGILRVYYHSLTKNVSWETGIEWAALTDKCLVKGVCGLNSYCSLLDGVNGEQSCLCPSGFSFVDSNQRTLGCTKSYTGGDCMKDDSEMITMVVMKNTTRNMEMEEEGLDCTLAEWVYECFEEGHLNKVLTEDVVEMEELERMVKVGLWCVQSQPGIRPSMKDVLIMLEGNITISPPPPLSSFS
ncbi:hypothetical protein J5N97_012005 [Dioscorea zingiberensis]|uniref:S-locus receptor kinase n=1 Tax=Dioscorea zingiberensis TaxID=325984 RepID=A0A9D5HHA5_9LILI|nr:hypothetical protein J5N97_012005 [Dioscorea zingiberensis]